MYKFLDSKLISFLIKLLPLNLNLKLRNYFFLIFYSVSRTNSLDSEDLKLNKILLKQFGQIDYKNIQIFDVGSGHPKIHSNSYFFYKRGSSTVAVDTNKNLIKLYKKSRNEDVSIYGAVSNNKDTELYFYEMTPWEVSTTNYEWYKKMLEITNATLVSKNKVPVITFNDLLENYYNTKKSIHILMVDIEGESSNLINSIDFGQYDFDVVLVEKEAKKNFMLNTQFKLEMEDKFNYFFIKL
jgi:hypothetical protein